MTNNNNNIFEIVTRNRFRFQFKGSVSVEDLWQLSLKDLDTIFKALSAQIKTSQEPSLLVTKTTEDEELLVKIEIVKYIFNVKQAEETSRVLAKERREKKQKIMEILAEKQDAALHNKSDEELIAMLNELE